MKDGREFVLELNNSANGFYYDHEEEDARLIADIVIDKMAEVPSETTEKVEITAPVAPTKSQSVMWQYRLAGQEDLLGPFSSTQMREWVDLVDAIFKFFADKWQGYFKETVAEVKQVGQPPSEFKPVLSVQFSNFS